MASFRFYIGEDTAKLMSAIHLDYREICRSAIRDAIAKHQMDEQKAKARERLRRARDVVRKAIMDSPDKKLCHYKASEITTIAHELLSTGEVKL